MRLVNTCLLVFLPYIMEMVVSNPFLFCRRKGRDELDKHKRLSSMGKGAFSISIIGCRLCYNLFVKIKLVG